MGCPADGDRHLSYCRHRTQRTESKSFEQRIADAAVRLISAATVLEAAMVIETRLGTRGGIELDLWLHKVEVEIVPVDAEQADQAQRAWPRFGKGRHPAGLNLGDCFSYALSALTQEPLLFKGDDFSKTDIEAA
jgi:ribonuclease VapC